MSQKISQGASRVLDPKPGALIFAVLTFATVA